MVGIYKITSPSGKVYIGQSWEIERRILKYKSINRSKQQPYLNKSFKKHGIDRLSAIANFKIASEKKFIPVVQYDLAGVIIREFASIKEASISLNIVKSSISHACIGKYKTAGGFKWKYA